jgi:peptide/nickel transport system ATP-binding protein
MSGALTSEIPALVVEDLDVHYRARRRLFTRTSHDFHAVQNVSLSVQRGKALGVVGESGSGKSTLAKAIIGLVEPSAGSIRLDGETTRDIPRLEFARSVQFVFQDPYSSLNPRRTVRETLEAPLRHLIGLDARARERRVAELLDLVGLRSEFASRYPHEFSGGQRQRVGIARALATNARLLILDEPVSALDVSVQAQVLNLLRSLQSDLGLTYVFIAHDLAVVENLCDDVVVMYRGRVVESSSAENLFDRPLHPYAQTLLAAVPDVTGKRRTSERVPGAAAEGMAAWDSCAFATRCAFVTERCRSERPPLREVLSDHAAACHRVEDIQAGVADPRREEPK